MNRGYGVVWRIGDLKDWEVIDPSDPRSPPDRTPVFSRGPLDLDADGQLTEQELTERYDPLIALQSKTSTAVWAELRVIIVPESAQGTPLRSFAHASIEDAELVDDGSLIGHANGSPSRLTLLEQREYPTEGGGTRRQIVVLQTFGSDAPHAGLVRRLLLRQDALSRTPSRSAHGG